MAISSQGTRTGIQVGLGIVILVLAYFLYRSITEPYERIERQQRITEQTRERMSNIRTALIDYERDSTSYPDSLNILVQHIQADSILATRQDSVFGGPINLDSLLFSRAAGSRSSTRSAIPAASKPICLRTRTRTTRSVRFPATPRRPTWRAGSNPARRAGPAEAGVMPGNGRPPQASSMEADGRIPVDDV